jgi:hypothetical protein
MKQLAGRAACDRGALAGVNETSPFAKETMAEKSAIADLAGSITPINPMSNTEWNKRFIAFPP